MDLQTLWVDPYNGLKTQRNDIIFDRGMSFEAACRKLEHEKGADDASGFRRSRRPIFGRTMFLLALQKVGTPGVFSICRPNTGTSFFDMEVITCVVFLPCLPCRLHSLFQCMPSRRVCQLQALYRLFATVCYDLLCFRHVFMRPQVISGIPPLCGGFARSSAPASMVWSESVTMLLICQCTHKGG